MESDSWCKIIETIIPEDDSVRLLSQFVDAMDSCNLRTVPKHFPSIITAAPS